MDPVRGAEAVPPDHVFSRFLGELVQNQARRRSRLTMTDDNPRGEIILYQTEDGLTRVVARFGGETAWLSLNQMAVLFQRDKSVISRRLKNIFDEGELGREAVVANFATTAADGKSYHVDHYNLDAVIAVGFKTVQNKMHWAAHGRTAAEIIHERADAERPNMGLTNWPGPRPRKRRGTRGRDRTRPRSACRRF